MPRQYIAVLLLIYAYPIEARELDTARIEGMLWPLAEGFPHQTSIVVGAIPVGYKVENLKVAHSNSNSYILKIYYPAGFSFDVTARVSTFVTKDRPKATK